MDNKRGNNCAGTRPIPIQSDSYANRNQEQANPQVDLFEKDFMHLQNVKKEVIVSPHLLGVTLSGKNKTSYFFFNF